MSQKKIRAGIIGASGYTGVELVRLLMRHPQVEIVALVAASKAGQAMADLYPHLEGLALPPMVAMDEAKWDGVDVVFCGLPHGTSQQVIASLPEHLKIIDLSADFRLRDVESYAEWYGQAHQAVRLQEQAVYGLVEHYREQVKSARLIANPGCYPTSILLPLLPLVKAGLIEVEGIVSDSKSGVSGAGRSAKEANLYAEVAESVHAYGVGNHRHTPEIEQELSVMAGKEVQLTFTPHLMPMTRGIFSTIYVKMMQGVTVAHLRETLQKRYQDEAFVTVLPEGKLPATRAVRGSNYVQIGVSSERRKGHAVVLCAIDNLIKGASGQAIQNMNVMCGLPESLGLEQLAMIP